MISKRSSQYNHKRGDSRIDAFRLIEEYEDVCRCRYSGVGIAEMFVVKREYKQQEGKALFKGKDFQKS